LWMTAWAQAREIVHKGEYFDDGPLLLCLTFSGHHRICSWVVHDHELQDVNWEPVNLESSDLQELDR
jgi:hypothetical protein